MPDGQQFSAQDMNDLREIATHLPAGHPMQGKLSKLLNSQPTQFEQDRAMPQGSPLWRGVKAVGSDLAGVASGIGDAITGGPMGAISKAPAAAGNLIAADANRKNEGYSPAYRGASALTTASGLFDPSGMEESARHGDTAGVFGHGIVPAASAATLLAAGPAQEGIESSTGLKPNIGKRVVDVTGRPKPVTRLLFGNERAQAFGELLNPDIADARIARHAKLDALDAGKTAPGPFRPGLEPKPQLGSPENPGMFAKIPTTMPKGLEPKPVDPFAGMTPTNKPIGNAEVPSFGGPFAPPPTVEYVNKYGSSSSRPTEGLIVRHDSPPPPRKVTYQSAAQPDLLKKVMSGDRDAIAEWDRRSLPRPPGVGFLVEPGAPNIPWGKPR